jgi:Tfp pilus assembly protein PilO
MSAHYIYLKKILISTLVAAAIITGALFGFIFPSAKNLQKIKSSVLAQKNNLEKGYIQGRNLRKTAEDLKMAEPYLEAINKMFINEEEVLSFVTTLAKTAENSGVTQRIILNSQIEKLNGTIQKIPLQLSSTGNFYQQMKLLKSLETLDYYINIKALEISGRPGIPVGLPEEDSGRIDMQLAADTYWK